MLYISYNKKCGQQYTPLICLNLFNSILHVTPSGGLSGKVTVNTGHRQQRSRGGSVTRLIVQER